MQIKPSYAQPAYLKTLPKKIKKKEAKRDPMDFGTLKQQTAKQLKKFAIIKREEDKAWKLIKSYLPVRNRDSQDSLIEYLTDKAVFYDKVAENVTADNLYVHPSEKRFLYKQIAEMYRNKAKLIKELGYPPIIDRY